ncbi:MAG: hypothetical protein CMC82_03730 [Flavobacteriaceae bacterium]|nr:hypothetical protein [Flavobacteriaceae bacterium]
MLPDDFDFAQLPEYENTFTLQEVGMLSSTIETIDYSIMSWLKEDLNLSAKTNAGYTQVPVYWQTPERAFQVKEERSLRDENGSLILPVISMERTGITKDPDRKGGFQAQIFSDKKDGRTGRLVIAKKVKQDKTRNFAVATGTRSTTEGVLQKYFPRINKQVVIQTLSIPIPVYVNLEYKITIKTEFQQQMNSLMQPFMARTGQINSFLMRRNGHIYEAFIDQNFAHNNNAADLNEDNRMYSTDIVIRVLGYLIGEGENDDRPIVRLDENFVVVTFPREQGAVPGNPSFFED